MGLTCENSAQYGIPLLVRGVVARAEARLVSDHPVCAAKVGFAEIFLDPQAPLFTRREINSLTCFCHSLESQLLKAGSGLCDIQITFGVSRDLMARPNDARRLDVG